MRARLRPQPLTPRILDCCAATVGEHPLGVNGSSKNLEVFEGGNDAGEWGGRRGGKEREREQASHRAIMHCQPSAQAHDEIYEYNIIGKSLYYELWANEPDSRKER